MTAEYAAELVVLGGGPGGYAAAFHAADHGMNVTLVNEESAPGGVCLHRGCIPSKALLHVAKLLNETKEAAHCGLTFAPPKIDLNQVRSWKGDVVGKLVGGVTELCQQRGVKLLRARGSFLDSNTLKLRAAASDQNGSPVPETLKFDKAIVAVGSLPAVPPMFQLDDPRIMDSTAALELADVPNRLLVVGGGYIGLELGSVYAALGSKVTVVELTDTLLPGADRDLVRPLQKRLEQSFAAIHLQVKVAKLEPTPEGIVAHLEGAGAPPTAVFDRVLIAVGRRPNSRGVGLENTKVQVDEKGFIKVDALQRTADPSILAIGDVAGEPMLAHKASREGKVAVEGLLGQPAAFDNVAIPAVVFTDPEIAWCGLTEGQAKADGRDVKVLRFPWAASGRARTLDRTEGATKLIFDPETECVLGVGIVGPGAGELIAEGTLAVEMGAVARDLADTIHAHPTLAETIGEAAEAFFGQATHIYRPAAAGRK
ncbi:MAG: dihydrolipoyl dehydrogenase [Planctomycetia bacterium]